MGYRDFERRSYWTSADINVKNNIKNNEFVKSIREKLLKKKLSKYYSK